MNIVRKLLVVAGLVTASSTAACVGEDPGRSESPIDDEPAPPAEEQEELDLHVVRDPSAKDHPAYGAKVTISGIVTGVKNAGSNHGFFVQAPNEPKWGAIYVFVGPADVAATPGTMVRASGTYQQFRGLDQINVIAGTIEAKGNAPVPAPIEVDVAEIANGGPRSLELQSVSLLVKGVIATRATTSLDFMVKGTSGDAELIVTSFWANDVGPSPFPATMNQRFASIRGFGTRFGSSDATTVAKLAPLAIGDLVVE